VEPTLLAALHAEPNDETTWLALADWLEEDAQADRAELVRLVRRLRVLPVMEVTPERAEMEARVAELLNAGVRPVVPEVVNSIGMRLALIPHLSGVTSVLSQVPHPTRVVLRFSHPLSEGDVHGRSAVVPRRCRRRSPSVHLHAVWRASDRLG
jgi:uncharacterized protein (TIGR02996 family)